MHTFKGSARSFAHVIIASVLLVVARGQSTYPTPYTMTTIAGISNIGSADGTGGAARFNAPNAIVADTAGNFYLADTNNHLIRKITSAGVVTTYAGLAGVTGSTDGSGSSARFKSPNGIAIDSSGNLYVTDSGNYTIRKISTAGVVSTLAGSAGSFGSTDGAGAAARFDFPGQLTVDTSGNVFVADTGNHTIRKITSVGVVTTVAGTAGASGSTDGTGAAARFAYPGSVTVDSATGNLYVADTLNHTIRKITPAGVVTTLAGSAGLQGSTDGTGSAARFYLPLGVTWAANNTLLVADTFNSVIRVVSSSGSVQTQIGQVGSSGSSDGVSGKLGFPYGVILVGGTYAIADTGNSTVRQYTLANGLTTLAGAGRESAFGSTDGVGTAARLGPMEGAVVGPTGDVFVTDTVVHRIKKITPAGVVSTVAGSGTSGSADGTGTAASFKYPSGLTIDTAGNLYVADTDNHLIRKVTPAGVVSTVSSNVTFYYPYDVAVDSAGNLYVADTGNNAIRKITPAGVATTLAGKAGISGSSDGVGSTALFDSPKAIVVDASGNLFVADTGNDTIRKITPDGTVTTLAGDPAFPGRNDGIGPVAHFNGPVDLAIDANGNLYVSDYRNTAIRKVTPAGVVTTLAGRPGSPGNVDGTGSNALLYSPQGIAIAADGTIYVANGSTFLKGVPAFAPTFTAHPTSQTVTAGGTVVFSATVTGTPAPTYQWRLNDNNISGATSASLTITNVQSSNVGNYTLVATNAAGSATSNAAVLSLSAATPTTSPSGGGGGGGAPSAWFWLALVVLGLGRYRQGRRSGAG